MTVEFQKDILRNDDLIGQDFKSKQFRGTLS